MCQWGPKAGGCNSPDFGCWMERLDESFWLGWQRFCRSGFGFFSRRQEPASPELWRRDEGNFCRGSVPGPQHLHREEFLPIIPSNPALWHWEPIPLSVTACSWTKSPFLLFTVLLKVLKGLPEVSLPQADGTGVWWRSPGSSPRSCWAGAPQGAQEREMKAGTTPRELSQGGFGSSGVPSAPPEPLK